MSKYEWVKATKHSATVDSRCCHGLSSRGDFSSWLGIASTGSEPSYTSKSLR
jgi:hypothetical protein